MCTLHEELYDKKRYLSLIEAEAVNDKISHEMALYESISNRSIGRGKAHMIMIYPGVLTKSFGFDCGLNSVKVLLRYQ